MRVQPPIDDRDPTWLAFRLALWPEVSRAAHLEQMTADFGRNLYVRIASSGEGVALGFIEATTRAALGGDPMQAVFIEGLYVSKKARCLAVTRPLLQGVAIWAATEGCHLLAYDSRCGLEAGRVLERAFGFQELADGIYFRKTLTPGRIGFTRKAVLAPRSGTG